MHKFTNFVMGKLCKLMPQAANGVLLGLTIRFSFRRGGSSLGCALRRSVRFLESQLARGLYQPGILPPPDTDTHTASVTYCGILELEHAVCVCHANNCLFRSLRGNGSK